MISNETKQTQHNLAMTVALISWAMLFATLFMGYAIYRSAANVWPPMGFTKISLTLPTLSTVIIVLSSYFCFQMKNESRQGNIAKAKTHLNITLVFAFMFLISQTFLWKGMNASGVYVSSGVFASILHAFTWIHAAHVAAAVLFLVYLAYQFKTLPESPERLYLKVLNAEKFWHFLGIIWILMYFILFVF